MNCGFCEATELRQECCESCAYTGHPWPASVSCARRSATWAIARIKNVLTCWLNHRGFIIIIFSFFTFLPASTQNSSDDGLASLLNHVETVSSQSVFGG